MKFYISELLWIDARSPFTPFLFSCACIYFIYKSITTKDKRVVSIISAIVTFIGVIVALSISRPL